MVGRVLVLLILIYCMIGDFLTAVLGLGRIRLACLIGIVLLLPIYYLHRKDKMLTFILFFVVSFIVLFYIVCGNTDRTSFFYTILFGYLLFKEKPTTLKYLDYIFVLQFVLILIEVIINRHFYVEVYSGIINPVIIDYSEMEKYFDETGFRPKGLFFGTLIGCSFTIFYSIINKEDKKRVLGAVVMALLMNGRLAILLTLAVAAFHFFKNRQTRKYDIRKFARVVMCLLAMLFIAYPIIPNVRTRTDRILSAFIFDDRSNNLGRAMRYVWAYNTYINEYDLKSKLFGGEYDIKDEYGRSVAAESDVIGMLLEIGIVGSFTYWVALFKMIKCKSDEFVPIWFVTLLTILAWIEYRHLTGNVRGLMFWLIYFMYIDGNKKKLRNTVLIH